MSKIDKLSILGVRSFDNQKSETIQFHTPLTLIVGLNGSGKTTIIECLKYATTGELPPNAKVGGAFIHDPKLCGEKEVLAQVRVSFRSTEGTRMVCTRSLQLTVKKATRRMKTLEGNLLIMRDGEKISISSRVAEMDAMMPQYLGVSKAILDSVIFCHQEESLWPLSEPSKLKQRFDEIFEALKYTKAIDNIKVLQKQQKQQLQLHIKDEEHSKENKDKANKMEKQSRKLHAEIDELRNQSQEMSTKIKDAAKQAETAWGQAEEAGMIVGQLTGKRIEARTKEESVNSLKQNLNEMPDSDEELQRMLEQYEERVQAYEDDLKTQTTHYHDVGRDVQDARERVSAKERECGSYEAQKENYDRQVENRESLVKETARSHNIRGFDSELDDDQVQAFIERISKMARDQNAAFERSRQETKEELGKAQKVLNQINEQKLVLNQRKESSKQTIANNDRKINGLQTNLNNISVDEGGKAAMESSLRETEVKLQSAKTDTATADWDSNIENAESELRKLDEHKEKLDAELVEGTRKAGDSAQLDFLQKERKDRQSSLETMVGAHGDKISSVIGQGWTPGSVEADFQRALERSSSHTAEAERQRDGSSRELEQVDFKLNTCKASLKVKRETLKSAEEAIRKAADCEPVDYLDELSNRESSRDYVKSDEVSFTVINQYFDQCIKDAQSQSTCRTCARRLKDKEIEALIRNVERMRRPFTTDEKQKETLGDLEQGLEEAKKVRSEYDMWERVKHKEIPALEEEEAALSEKRQKLVNQLEAQDAVVGERQSAKRDVEYISRTVQNVAKYSSDIASFDTQIEQLANKQKTAGLTRGLEQIQDDLKKVNDESKAVKARLATITRDRDRSRGLINSLEHEVRDIRSKLSTAEYQLKEKTSLEGQVEEFKVLNNEQRESIKSIDKELQSLVPRLSEAQAKYEEISFRGAEKDRELQAETSKLNSNLNQLKMADKDIRAYLDKGGLQQLARGKREVDTLKGQVNHLEGEQKRAVHEVKALEDQLRNHAETKRGIADNQRYRRDLRQLTQVRLEIGELEKHNAEEDKARWEREGNKLQMERNRIAAEQATIVGALKIKDDQLRQYLEDYETDYKDAKRKYKEAHIKVETTKACVDDLGRYGGALDKAIMKYHSVKMEEINRIIEELWRKTYQGTDVDTILIRSESENVRTNKSYNYRVCMVKQDAEMDMRGRCSAGQKVLASIIIRLALAECFGVNCGLIALDEPTTNLDRDNIKALAESLAEIIRLRRQQSNFQLIVITHDEEFLRYMGCADYADVYYRVSRNAKQKSQIERQSIAEVV